jgi:hypothetical protein
MPTYADQEGTFLHAASGGGVRMDDPCPDGEEGRTRMQRESTGQYTTLPEGEPMIWINEYYYLDGTITITDQERTNGATAAYNLGVTPVDFDTVMSELVGDGSASYHRGVAHDVEEEATSSAEAPASEEPTAAGPDDGQQSAGEGEAESPAGDQAPAGEAEDGLGPQQEGADLAATGSDGSDGSAALLLAAAAFVAVGGGTMAWVRRRHRAVASSRP